jgi:hydrogenase maturation protease
VRRIVCVGSRLVAEDAAGPAVYDLLSARPLPKGVEVIDGGLGGLSLLRMADGAEGLVFVDAVSGFGAPGEVLLLPAQDVAAEATPDGHAGGLPFLLALLPRVSDMSPGEVAVVGLEAPWDDDGLARAASLAVATASGPGRAEGGCA